MRVRPTRKRAAQLRGLNVRHALSGSTIAIASGGRRAVNWIDPLPATAPQPGRVAPPYGFAGRAAGLASRAPFFAFCLLLVLIWLIQGVITLVATRSFGTFLDATYQLEMNTTTTIITFLMVALLQNSQTRENQATSTSSTPSLTGLPT